MKKKGLNQLYINVYAAQIFKYVLLLFVLGMSCFLKAQAPDPALIGYFQNWQDPSSPYIQLDQVDSRYNTINIAFAIPKNGTDYDMEFIPDQVSQATFISQIGALQAQGKKVIISVGGATAPISLDDSLERNTFVVSMTNIINTYGFDGIDIDLEGNSVLVTGGTIVEPVDQKIINLIDAVKQIMGNYYTKNGRSLILTMAPETAFVQGGQSSYGGIWGAYLPVIHALRDSIEVLHVQLYNSGSMYGIDGNIYTQGTADFIVAMCEAVIQGFNTSGGTFVGLPASKIAVGLPACSSAAGGGYTDTGEVKAAIDYLRGNGTQPGSYSLIETNGYPDFRGMMTWSINWDALASCGGENEFAANYKRIFENTASVDDVAQDKESFYVYPNPVEDLIKVEIVNGLDYNANINILNSLGQVVFSKKNELKTETIDISSYPKGIYTIRIGSHSKKVIKQ